MADKRQRKARFRRWYYAELELQNGEVVKKAMGEWFSIGKRFQMGCCRCGFMHTWRFRVRGHELQMAVERAPQRKAVGE